ncbi:MAG: hypothetical protein LC790_01290 [Actinobacteria bacterium]|nr:hypothetical protein [Actinomycetota bacterium]
MTLGHSPTTAAYGDDRATAELALILRNARAMGIADERVAVALNLTPTMLARIQALLASGDGRAQH